MTKQLCIAFLFSCFVSQAAFSDESLCQIATGAIEQASNIRSLRVKSKVPCEVHDKEKVKNYLLDTLENKVTFEKLRKEEAVFKALGFIPEDFNYKDGIVELYLGQIGGYYDPDKSYYVMAGWLPAMLQTTIAVHELTHALQDQYFNLQTFLDLKMQSNDELLARSALVEGDATAVMYDFARVTAGQKRLEEESNVEGLMLQSVISASMVAGMGKVPKTLQSMLIFPYTSGLRFAHELLRKGGYKQIDQAFNKPPRSTEEILHPEKYFHPKKDFIEIEAEGASKRKSRS